MRALEPYQSKGVQRGYAATAEQLDQILSIYDAYDVTIGAPGEALKGPALPDALRGALHNGYEFTQIGRKLACVRVDLMSGIELCPICGISAPRELDHHLPRSAYHPLAIYVRNLVPLCHDCNHSKSKAEAEDPAQRFSIPILRNSPASISCGQWSRLRTGG